MNEENNFLKYCLIYCPITFVSRGGLSEATESFVSDDKAKVLVCRCRRRREDSVEPSPVGRAPTR